MPGDRREGIDDGDDVISAMQIRERLHLPAGTLGEHFRRQGARRSAQHGPVAYAERSERGVQDAVVS